MRFFIILSFISHLSVAQILTDGSTQPAVIHSLDLIYEGKFAEAEQGIAKLREKYPKHPLIPLMQSLKTSWQYLPIERNPQALKIYQQQLESCIALALPMLQKAETSSEAKFFLLAGHGFKALSMTYQGQYLQAANQARLAHNYLKDGMDLVNTNPEFYYTAGLYNFYVEQYPETHPIVKPAMIFFQDGNKKKGLEQLALAAQKGTFVRTEALYYLMNINTKYLNNPAKSLSYSKILVEKYPHNLIYAMRHAQYLILTGKTDEAALIIQKLHKNPDKIYQFSSNVLDGLLAERTKNDKTAQAFYLTALKTPFDERHTKHFAAYAWAGLARIASRQGETNQAKIYYKKCLEIAEYIGVQAEANAFLKTK